VTTTWRLPVPARDPVQVDAAAARILSEKQFHPAPSLWQRFWNWVEDLLSGLHIPGVRVGGGSAPPLGDVVIGVLIAAAIVVVVIAARRGAFARWRHSARGEGVLVTEEGDVLPPDAWRREADRLAAEGMFREALRCRYRALVAELAARGLLDEVPGRTSGDYEQVVSAVLPEVAGEFSTITRLFERCWYGREPSDAPAQVTFEAMAAAIIAAVDRAGRDGWPALPSEPELTRLR